MEGLYFGTAGVPLSAGKTTLSGIERIAELGLGCMELEFVRRVNLKEEAAVAVRDKAQSLGVRLSVHASYYINFNSLEPDKVLASQERLFQAARIGALAGALSVIFHPGYYMGIEPEEAYRNIRDALTVVLERLDRENIKIKLRPELTGKASQFGAIDEIIALCQELPGVAPCIDFAHAHARYGTMNTYGEVAGLLGKIKISLGQAALEDLHIHLSGIRYGVKGELSHLNLNESDMNYPEVLKALGSYGVKGLLICESPSLEEDALLLKKTYQAMPFKSL